MKALVLATAPTLPALGKVVERFFVGNPPPLFNEDGTISRMKEGQQKAYVGVAWDRKKGRYRFIST